MSSSPSRMAQVYDVPPARLLSLMESDSGSADASATVAADLADGIEAIQQIANLAGYSVKVRHFIFALASAAHNQGGVSVALFDEELAEQMGCSTKTVQRRRAEYLKESRSLRTVDLISIEEGEFVRENNRHAPTRYTFHLTNTIQAVVADARSDPRWHELDRKAQRELLKRAAERAYDLIPNATRKIRKRKRPRLASAVLETHRKAADTHLRKLSATARQLPPAERERLFSEPGGVPAWWLSVRAEMDELCGGNSSNSVARKDLEGGSGQSVIYPFAEEESNAAELNTEDQLIWDSAFQGLLPQPMIRTVEVSLRPPERPPGDLSNELNDNGSKGADAARAEGRGEVGEVE